MDLKKLLNPEQYDAATTVDGQLLILAGAGSGKTRVLTYRIAHMLEDLGIKSYNILAITFTNKAAGEMRERVKSLIGDEADNMWISTFHSTCVKILRREIDKLGYKKDFTIYDTSDQKTLIKEVIKTLNINDKDISDSEILSKISDCKDKLITPTMAMREWEQDFRLKKIGEAYILYQKKLKENNALDFDDLIVKTVELFKQEPEVLDFYQNKFKYIMIDEYQDTNKTQYEFVKMLAGKYKNICVVGDDDQCIYAWRGADIRNILDFEKDYPKAKVVKLERNYRSMGNILMAANSVIKHNIERKDKALKTEAESGEKIKVYRAYSDQDEGQFVANEIKKKIEELQEDKNLTYKDFAVLYRTNAQSRIFEDAFRKNTIPYRIVGGTKFYDRKEIKDILAYLKVLVNPQDSISLKRIINVPKRSIGDTTVEKVREFADSFEMPLYDAVLGAEAIPTLSARNITAISKFTTLMDELEELKEQLPVSHLMEAVLEKTGYIKELEKTNSIEDKSRIENLKELVTDAVEFEKSEEEDKSLSTYLEKVSLVQDVDNKDVDAESVVLMTVHSAKGLEFPVVFMVGMENGMFPGSSSFDSEQEMEESRRLCYVGITRAKEILYMTSAEMRRVFGRTVAYPASDFLLEIPKDLKEGVDVKGTSVGAGMTKDARNNYIGYGNKKQGYTSQYTRNNIKKTPSQAMNALEAALTESSSGRMLTKEEATAGRKIKHAKFGVGTIVNATPQGSDIKLMIAFDSQGIKTLMLSFAPLEVL